MRYVAAILTDDDYYDMTDAYDDYEILTSSIYSSF